MRKIIIILILCLMVSNIVTATEYISGGIIDLYNIEKCDGPITIKVTPDIIIKNNELKIEKCSIEENNIWTCNCNNNFNIRILTEDDTKNTYDFLIQYYTQYKAVKIVGNQTPSLEEIERDNYLRTQKILNVIIQPAKPIKRLFKIDMQTKNSILFAVLLFLFIVAIVIFKWKKKFGGGPKKENNDIMNYKVTRDENINDILKYIK